MNVGKRAFLYLTRKKEKFIAWNSISIDSFSLLTGRCGLFGDPAGF